MCLYSTSLCAIFYTPNAVFSSLISVNRPCKFFISSSAELRESTLDKALLSLMAREMFSSGFTIGRRGLEDDVVRSTTDTCSTFPGDIFLDGMLRAETLLADAPSVPLLDPDPGRGLVPSDAVPVPRNDDACAGLFTLSWRLYVFPIPNSELLGGVEVVRRAVGEGLDEKLLTLPPARNGGGVLFFGSIFFADVCASMATRGRPPFFFWLGVDWFSWLEDGVGTVAGAEGIRRGLFTRGKGDTWCSLLDEEYRSSRMPAGPAPGSESTGESGTSSIKEADGVCWRWVVTKPWVGELLFCVPWSTSRVEATNNTVSFNLLLISLNSIVHTQRTRKASDMLYCQLPSCQEIICGINNFIEGALQIPASCDIRIIHLCYI